MSTICSLFGVTPSPSVGSSPLETLVQAISIRGADDQTSLQAVILQRLHDFRSAYSLEFFENSSTIVKEMGNAESPTAVPSAAWMFAACRASGREIIALCESYHFGCYRGSSNAVMFSIGDNAAVVSPIVLYIDQNGYFHSCSGDISAEVEIKVITPSSVRSRSIRYAAEAISDEEEDAYGTADPTGNIADIRGITLSSLALLIFCRQRH